MEINYKAFYTQYAYDYHLYKVTTLSSILDKNEAFQKDYLAEDRGGEHPGSTNFVKEAVVDMMRTHNGSSGFIMEDIITRRKI